MKRIINLTVDFKSKIYNTIFLKQMDTTVFIIKILDNNIIANLNDQTIDILFTKPNDKIVQQLSSNIDTEKGIATIPLKEDCVRHPGKAKMELEVKNTNSEVISSFYIPIFIEKTSKGNVESEDMPNYFEEFSKAIDDLKNNSTEMLENIKKAEETRQQNEEKRTESEKTRTEAEKTRVSKEKERVSAEETRQQNEDKRKESETARKEAEKKRVSAEETRNENENTRKEAENSRALAEEKRAQFQKEFKEYIENNKVASYKYRLDIVNDTELGDTITIPCYYKVGANVLDVYYVGQRLIKCTTNDDLNTGHYSEVGDADSISNQIKITSDWKASAGNYFEFVVT